MLLNELKIGKEAEIINILGTGVLRHRLLELGLTPKAKIMIVKMAPLGDPIEIKIRGYELTIRKDEAELIEVGELK